MSANALPSAPGPIARVLESSGLRVVARVLLTLPFWSSGLAKLADFGAATAEMAHFGLHPPELVATVTILTQLGGAALVIQGRHAWLGAGALGVFTALTIPLVHNFWALDGEPGMLAMFFALEHTGMIGGLMLAAILCHRRA